MQRINSVLILLILSQMVSSCIKPYDPDIQSKDVQKYVVSGQLTDDSSQQIIYISMTSPVDSPRFIPVSGCRVTISDNKGNEFPMSDIGGGWGHMGGDGSYRTWINPAFMVPGAAFKIDIITPSGEHISSDFDQLKECPDVDSVYYDKKAMQTANTGKTFNGIEFYLDLKGTAKQSRNFRWEVTETWEHHADYELQWYYDGTTHHVWPPDYSMQICWTTANINTIFTLSTGNLAENKYFRFPLNFVGSEGPRLVYGYSLLVKQYGLSEQAYNYWDQLRINSTQQGGLYAKQPLAIKGNLHNITNPGVDVLGFFGASSVKTKRVFIKNVPDLPLTYSPTCTWDTLGKDGYAAYSPSQYPLYLMGTFSGPKRIVLAKECVDCRSRGGNNIKPSFWP